MVEKTGNEGGNNRPDIINNRNIVIVFIWAAITVTLYLLSSSNYLLYHSLAEIFSIVIAFGIFTFAWNARRIIDNHYLMFIGIAYLFIGGIDFLHILAYRGMGVFPDIGSNLATQLWIAARYLQAASLLIAPFFINRKLKINTTLVTFAVVTALIIGTIFYWQIFPDAFSEETGLTPFKIISEYIVSAILLIAAWLLYKSRNDFHPKVRRFIIASIFVTIASEMAFTLYTDAYGLMNMAGHILKIVAFFLIYKALVETGLKAPYELLFHNLRQSEKNLTDQASELSRLNDELLQEVDVRKRAETLAQQSEQKYRNLFSMMTEAFAFSEIILDDSGKPCDYRFIEVNKAFYELTGLSDVEGKTAKEVIPDMEQNWIDTYADVAISGTPIHFENYSSPLDRWYDVYAYSPEEMHFVTLFRDITTQKKIENDTISLSKFPSENPNVVLRISADGRILYANAASSPLLEFWKTSEGQSLPEQYRNMASEIIRTGTRQGVEVEYAGHVLFLYFTPIEEMGYLNIYGTDITSRKRGEDALRKSQNDLKRAQTVALIGSWRLDVRQNTLIWSDETYRIFGIPADTIMTYERFLDSVHPDDREYVDNEWNAALQGEEYDIEHRVLVDNEIKWVREIAELEFDEQGMLVGGFGTVQDITDIKKAEQIKDEFIGLVSHELRTPLTIIIGSLRSAMPPGISPEDTYELLHNALEGAESLAEILENMLELSRYQANRLQLELRRTTIPDIAASVIEKLRGQGITQQITTDFPADLPRIKADPIRVERILYNLMENASKYSPAISEIKISCREGEGYIVTGVTDQGEGISSEDQEKLFEPFRRLISPARRTSGVGLGLVVCKRLVEAQGGWIKVESEPGKGATFSFALPIYQE